MVAALTIPSIVSRYEKRTIEAGLKKTYAELENWIKRAEEDFGPFDSWDSSNNSGIVAQKYLFPYFNLTSCNSNTKYCMAKNGAFRTWYKPTETSAPGELETSGQHMPKYILPDGRVFGVYTTYYSDWATPGKSITIFVDVNGPRGKTVMGQDVFAFSICNYRGIKTELNLAQQKLSQKIMLMNILGRTVQKPFQELSGKVLHACTYSNVTDENFQKIIQ